MVKQIKKYMQVLKNKKCTRHGIKYMHGLKKKESIQKLEEHYKHVTTSALKLNRNI